MRAIQFDQRGGPEVLRVVEIAERAPRAGEIRVRNHAIGVNFIDTYHRTGLYKVELPSGLGVEGAGVVEAVGPGVASFAVGDRVAYVSKVPGSYADAFAVEAAHATKLPAELGFETGAAMMLKDLTVELLLRRLHLRPEPGEPILWHAAAGGVGLIACQWAKIGRTLPLGDAAEAHRGLEGRETTGSVVLVP